MDEENLSQNRQHYFKLMPAHEYQNIH